MYLGGAIATGAFNIEGIGSRSRRRPTADPSARPGSPAGAEGEAVPMSGRARVMKVLMIATNYFEKNPGETHDDVRQLVRNVRPRFEARPRAETPPRAKTPPPAEAPPAFAGAFGIGSLFGAGSTGGGVFGEGCPSSGSIFGGGSTGGGLFGNPAPKAKK